MPSIETQPIYLKELAPIDDCGVYAVYSPQRRAFEETLSGIEILVNRGPQSNGIGFLAENGNIEVQRFLGPPNRDNYIHQPSHLAVGHDRYTTSKETTIENAQPAREEYTDDSGAVWSLALAHNGNVDLGSFEGEPLDMNGTESDSALMAQLIARANGKTWGEKLKNSLPKLNGSYSCTMLTPDGIWGFRDPRANRPLWVGEYSDGTKIISSETKELRERKGLLSYHPVPAGYGVCIDSSGEVTMHYLIDLLPEAKCAIEEIYLKRHDSQSDEDGHPFEYEVRQRIGKKLAQEHPLLKNMSEDERARSVVVSIPNGGIPFAEGFSEESGIRLEPLLTKILDERSFIATIGTNGDVAKNKIKVVEEVMLRMKKRGVKKIFLIDDSTIRGSQVEPVAQMIREAASKFEMNDLEIHEALGCPEVLRECGLGIAIEESELFYRKLKHILVERDIPLPENPDEHLPKVLQAFGLDSMYHISKKGMLEALTNTEIPEGTVELAQLVLAHGYCMSCMQEGDGFVPPDVWYRSEKY